MFLFRISLSVSLLCFYIPEFTTIAAIVFQIYLLKQQITTSPSRG